MTKQLYPTRNGSYLNTNQINFEIKIDYYPPKNNQCILRLKDGHLRLLQNHLKYATIDVHS